ncbi:MAG: cytochrome-c oxidase [Rhodanobacter sp. 68-29]|uniref:cbb3-type cytochrome oxidase subunit 3 n=1 Tax=Rhodanobacter sp. PCA2 TaxID=2006117 RepID=UPI00086D9310|nr:cbb3-type cytochrome c oxidase subunit 3 [Rhodanobacter sp. PCA2]MBA2077389.1 CcoQ/FixQ family Cbb3-type cytochrome c oxidase assembly chaperone [Rhodanobacter sp. PCA2]MBN8923545.1 cbb3-type cytochrome c oxidase subunit 3 [Rhodanobacter sp.]ODU74043.1 MAG: cytochrome-c oxidase [Rhodanobacter sp. SCN 69-32]OJY55400.1 MAG: cytochrome-c oxidase [Rhodanobacter sp. 68-29]
MSPFWGHLAGVMIVLMMLSFIGIWFWAWRRYHKPTFDRMAQLPMQDEDLPVDAAVQEKVR